MIEQAIHVAVVELLNNVARDHGLRISDIDVEWIDVSTAERSRFIIKEVRIETTYSPRPSKERAVDT